jgi:hypothetical protein
MPVVSGLCGSSYKLRQRLSESWILPILLGGRPELRLQTLSITVNVTVFYTVYGGRMQASLDCVSRSGPPCQVSKESLISKRVVLASSEFFLLFGFCIRDPSQIGYRFPNRPQVEHKSNTAFLIDLQSIFVLLIDP